MLPLPTIDGGFGCILADPPWLYGNQGTRGATSDHYAGLTVEQLCAMPIDWVAAETAHLHLWTTNAFLFRSQEVMTAWGFTYKSCFIWTKPQMGMGNYWRVSHEFLLLGVRGKNATFKNHSLLSWGTFKRGRHSAKPSEVHELIEKASPGPYLELFARSKRPGWTAWGNEVEQL